MATTQWRLNHCILLYYICLQIFIHTVYSDGSDPYVTDKRVQFERQPNGNIKRVIGDSLSIDCEAKSGQDGSQLPVTWLVNGTSISRNGTNLAIASLAESDAGWYQCAFTIDDGVVLSRRMQLSVTPTKVDSPTSLVLREITRTTDGTSNTVHLECSVGGDNQVVVDWWHDDQKIDDTSDRFSSVKIGETRHLQIDTFTVTDSGQYECRSSKDATVKSNRIVVADSAAGNSADHAVIMPLNQTIPIDGTVVFHCFVNGVAPKDISWRRLYPPQAQLPVERTSVIGGSFLKIASVKKIDAGQYACVAKLPNGKTESYIALLAVSFPPKFTERIRDVTVKHQLGSDRFSCRVEAYPSPVFEWYRNGKLVKAEKNVKIITPTDVSQSSATDPSQAKTSAEVISSREREKAESNSTHVDEAAFLLGGYDNVMDSSLRKPVYGSDLVILNSVSNENDGVYQCFARNSEGEISAAGVFHFSSTTNEAVDLNFDVKPNHLTGEMILTWTEEDPNHPSYLQIVDYNCVDGRNCVEGTRTINSASLSNAMCDSFGRCRASCCEASQPQPAVEYEFRLSLLYMNLEPTKGQIPKAFQTSNRVRVTTFDGRTTRSSPIQLFDLPNNDVRIEWNNKADELRSYVPGKVLKYLVEWRLVNNPMLNSRIERPPSFNSYVIKGLTTNEVYEIRVLAITRAGQPSKEQLEMDRDFAWTRYHVVRHTNDGTLAPVLYPQLPSPIMNADVLNSSTIIVDWHFPSDVDKTKLIRLAGYRVTYNVDILDEEPQNQLKIDIVHDRKRLDVMSKRAATITGLAPLTHYRISVMAMDEDGQPGLEAAMYLQTKEALPQPQSLKCEPDVKACTMKVSWNPMPSNRYELRYRIKSPSIFAIEPPQKYTLLKAEEVLHMETNRCSSEFTYSVSVRAIKSAETSPWTDDIECWLRSLDTSSDSPQNVSAQVVNTSTIYVKWRPPPNATKLNVIGYIVYYREHPANGDVAAQWSAEHVSGADTSILLKRLSHLKQYAVGVATVTSEGESPRTMIAPNPMLLKYAEVVEPASGKAIYLEVALIIFCVFTILATCVTACVLRKKLPKPAFFGSPRANRTSYNDYQTELVSQDRLRPAEQLLASAQFNEDDQIYESTKVTNKHRHPSSRVDMIRIPNWIRRLRVALFGGPIRSSSPEATPINELSSERHVSGGERHVSGQSRESGIRNGNISIDHDTSTAAMATYNGYLANAVAIPYSGSNRLGLTSTPICVSGHNNNNSVITSTTGASLDNTQSASFTELTVSESVELQSLMKDHQSSEAKQMAAFFDSKGGPEGAQPRGSKLLAQGTPVILTGVSGGSDVASSTAATSEDDKLVIPDVSCPMYDSGQSSSAYHANMDMQQQQLPITDVCVYDQDQAPMSTAPINMGDLLIPVHIRRDYAARAYHYQRDHSSGVEWSSDLSHSPVTASSLHSWSHDDRLSQPGCASLPNLTDSGIGFDSFRSSHTTQHPLHHITHNGHHYYHPLMRPGGGPHSNGLLLGTAPHGPNCCCHNQTLKNGQTQQQHPSPQIRSGPSTHRGRNTRLAWPLQRTSS